MKCKHCGKDNPGKRRFCAACGAPLAAPCPTCAFENDPSDKFCGGCGQLLARSAEAQGELRHVVVLFADLENYTGLSGRLDPDDVHKLLGDFFTAVDGAVASYGGKIDKHIGDNVMALFGAPIAHGNDAERAARAALDIHREVAALAQQAGLPLRVNIGIAAGQVMASGLGSDHHREYTVIGNAVNIAARLQSAAKNGETMIQDSVYRAIAALALADDAGALALKGVADPVRAWKLRSVADSGIGESRQLIGRDQEMRTLTQVLEQTAADGRGRVIVLRAEAGTGKSRLAQELSAGAAARGFAVHRMGFVDFGTPDRGLPAFLRDVVVPGWRAALAVDDPMQHCHLCALLDEPLPASMQGAYQALANNVRLDGRLKALNNAVSVAAKDRPLLLLMEDVHWIKPEGRLVLQALAQAARSHPVLLLLTARPEVSEASWWSQFDADASPLVVNLAPLSAEASAELATALGADETLRKQVIERAAGNPLYLTRAIVQWPGPTSLGSSRALPSPAARSRCTTLRGRRKGSCALAGRLSSVGCHPERSEGSLKGRSSA
jgi:class 3 adenylate cyclase